MATINEDGRGGRGVDRGDGLGMFPDAADNGTRELEWGSPILSCSPTARKDDIYENLNEVNGKRMKTKKIQTFACPRIREMEYRVYSEYPAPEYLSIHILRDRFETAKATWEKSGDCAELQQALLDGYDVEGTAANRDHATPVDCCVAFGLCSFSDTRYVAEWATSLNQLAYFLSMVEAIASRQPQNRPKIYAQDLLFNDLDRALLSSLGITPVEHPVGFNTLIHNSLAFCPRSGIDDLRILGRNPKFFIGYDLDTWLDDDGDEGQLCSHIPPASEEKVAEMKMNTISEEDHAMFARDGFVVVGDKDVVDDGEELRSRPAQQSPCYDAGSGHIAEFLKRFMENGRTRRLVPQTWEQPTFVIWRDDRTI